MYWSVVGERLIKRGELLLSFEFLECYDSKLMDLNNGKVGRPFKITDRYVEFLMVVRYLFSIPYRQLEGFTRALNRLIKNVGDEKWARMVGYGRSWAAETTFSIFKRHYGEYCMAKNIESIRKEIEAKTYIYNMLINL
ncbi:MAG: transposase [Nitrososphaerota archaeon]